jgi:anthranilate phosphoribosyltransferase
MEIKKLIHKRIGGQTLSANETTMVLSSVMTGELSEVLLSALLTAMKIVPETPEELLGAVKAMKQFAVKPKNLLPTGLLDTCGTGGDEKGSVNVSTLSALALASMGVKIAKHGNRAVSSICGSSDLLSGLGYEIAMSNEQAEERLLKNGFTFLFAPLWHPAMKHAANVRKELGFRTMFNLLGPLSNPFSPDYQIVGAFSKEVLPKLAFVLQESGLKSFVVCHSQDGHDEFSIFDKTDYLLYRNGKLTEETFDPAVLQISHLDPAVLLCKTKEEAIQKAKDILAGQDSSALRVVALNAGVAYFVIGRVASIQEGYNTVLEHLLSGKVSLQNLGE